MKALTKIRKFKLNPKYVHKRSEGLRGTRGTKTKTS